MHCDVSQREFMSVAGFAFQACLIDRSSISPFRIKDLQHRLKDDCGDCDTSQSAAITCGFSSIAAESAALADGAPASALILAVSRFAGASSR